MDHSDDPQFVMVGANFIDDDIGESTHHPLPRASDLTAVSESWKLAKPLDSLKNAANDRSSGNGIVSCDPG
jgi:hypothetical protein